MIGKSKHTGEETSDAVESHTLTKSTLSHTAVMGYAVVMTSFMNTGVTVLPHRGISFLFSLAIQAGSPNTNASSSVPVQVLQGCDIPHGKEPGNPL